MSFASSFSSTVIAARESLEAGREKLRKQHEQGSPGIQVSNGLTSMLDDILLMLFESAIENVCESDAHRRDLESNIALVAHGGYGRKDIAPYSDMDLMLLCSNGKHAVVAPLAKQLTQSIYDVGLQLGFSTRSPRDIMKVAFKDAKIFTSLVESRLLLGDKTLYRSYRSLFKRRSQKNTTGLLKAINEARQEERSQFGDTNYLLKPNVKRSRGTLRDLQLVRWAGFARFAERETSDLVKQGHMSKEDRRILRAARDFLLQLRNELHFFAGKSQDVLTRHEQVRIAKKLGYEVSQDSLPVERFMKEYFDHTSQVRYVTAHFLATCRPERRSEKLLKPVFSKRINDDFRMGIFHISARPGRLKSIQNNLVKVLELMELANKHNKRINHATWRGIRESMMSLDEIPLTDEAAAKFLELLSYPNRIRLLLRRLHEMRVLEKVIPAVKHARNLLQFNEYHKYTVDEHSIRAVGAAASFLNEDSSVGRAYRKITNKTILHLALLLHDLGKGFEEDHSDVGRRIATETSERLNLPDHDRENLEFLVHKHLIMAHAAFRQDLNDEQTIVQFASQVGSPELLQMLYVLTLADLKAVGPDVLTDWKRGLLAQLYRKTRSHLTGQSSDEASLQWLSEQHAEFLAAANETFDIADDHKLWWKEQAENLPIALLNLDYRESVLEYLRKLSQLPDGEVASWSRYIPKRNVVEYIIAAKDTTLAGCFHRLTGVFTSYNNAIHSAEIFELADGYAIDRFYVEDLDSNGMPSDQRLHQIEEKLKSSILQQEERSPKFRRTWQVDSDTQPEEVKPLPTHVGIDNSTAHDMTIITIFAYDKIGLLYQITRTLFELGLEVCMAKISTHLDQVVDVFYVTDRDGNQISGDDELHEIRNRLLEQL